MNELWKGLRLLGWMTVLTGFAYPLGVTGLGRLLFHESTKGSLITNGTKVVGSEWIGQGFSQPAYFWPRPSATNYGTLPSGGSNLSVTHRDFVTAQDERKQRFGSPELPADLLYASGSGLDPHISPQAARLQVERVLEARRDRGATIETIRGLVDAFVEEPTLSMIGQPRVNVLLLNLELDRRYPRVQP